MKTGLAKVDLAFFESRVVREWFGMELVMAGTCLVFIRPGWVPRVYELSLLKTPKAKEVLEILRHPEF